MDMGSSVPYVENWNEFPMNVTVSKDDLSLIKSDFKQAGFTHVNTFEEINWVDGKLEVFVEAKKS